MTIYILLLLYLLICGVYIYTRDIDLETRNVRFLNCAFIAIFLLYSLRASSVGRDLPEYERLYLSTETKAFTRSGYGNFEIGYIVFMFLCRKIGLSFQIFLTICNVIILFPIYRFIKKYAHNAFFSVLIYVCYIYFEFNMTGMRQAISSSIVLVAFMVLIESKKGNFIKYCLIVLFATLFHSGAFIGFFYIPFHFMKKYKTYVSGIVATSLVFLFGRGYIMSFIKNLFNKASMIATSNLYIGLNFVFLVILSVLFIIARYNREINLLNGNSLILEDSFDNESTMLFEKLFMLSVASLLLFGEDNSARAHMFLNQVIIVLLPNSICHVFTKRSRKYVFAILLVFFLIFIFTNTLIPNNFDIVPYKFFWEN